MVLVMRPQVGNSPKSGDDRIDQVFPLRYRRFDRVSASEIRSVRKEAVDDRRLRIFGYFFHIFSPDGADSLFQTDGRTLK